MKKITQIKTPENEILRCNIDFERPQYLGLKINDLRYFFTISKKNGEILYTLFTDEGDVCPNWINVKETKFFKTFEDYEFYLFDSFKELMKWVLN